MYQDDNRLHDGHGETKIRLEARKAVSLDCLEDDSR